MADAIDWTDELKRLCSLLDRAAEETVSMMEKPQAERIPLTELVRLVIGARDTARTLFDRMAFGPLERLIKGYRLSPEEFYLICAREPQLFPACRDLYDKFLMFHYEDDERIGYINPDERPLPEDQIKLRFGFPPEEILWNRLRPEQQKYFEEQQPDVAVRFRREA